MKFITDPSSRLVRRSRCREGWWAGWGLSAALSAVLSGAPVIDRVSVLEDGRFEIRFTDPSGAAAEHIVVRDDDLPADAWSSVLTLAEHLGGGEYRVRLPLPAANRFFRIVGNTAGVGADLDGDGLSDWQEGHFGTRADHFDTDGDGYGDALEVFSGSDPLDASDVPQLTWVNFEATEAVVREGAATVSLPVSFSRPYTGPLYFEIADIGSVDPATDLGIVLGLVTVTGATSAMLEIPLRDDAEIELPETLVVDLKTDPEGRYRVGGASRHVSVIQDNDSYWSGTLRTETTEQNFVVRLVESAAGMEATVVGRASAGRSSAWGTVPPGEFPFAAFALDASTLEATSSPIPIGEPALFPGVEFSRVFTLTAEPPPEGVEDFYERSENRILGRFEETITPTDPAYAFLAQTHTGLFVLVRQLEPLPVDAVASTSVP
jgi:hypothetical protein